MTSVSNMSDIKDRLSSLPAELLHEIFEHAHNPTQRLTTPLSKSLLPFQEGPLFRHLYAYSYKSLEALCNIAQRRPLALSHAETLTVLIACGPSRKGSTKESNDVKVPSNKLVRLLYRKLPKVSSFTLTGSSRLAQLALEPAVVVSAFPSLTILWLASTFRSIRNPFQPAFYATIQYYTELKVFGLYVWREAKSIHPDEKPLAQIPPFPTKIGSLTLRGPLSANEPVVKALLRSFGTLSTVSLSDTSESPQIYPLVDGLFRPELLKNLSLEVEKTPGARPSINDLAHLDRLNSLECLTFEGHASPPNYSSLQSLPLVSLTFEFGSQVSLSELTELISGPTKHATLKKIELNNVDGERGTTISEQGEPYYDEEAEDIDVYPDWILPDWTDEFDEDGLIHFIKLADREGIEVMGTAVEAIGIEEEHENEQDVLDEFGQGLGDFDGCG